MDSAINFYELKTQLADIGFQEPEIVNQLREAMFTEFSYEGLYMDRGNIRFQIDLNKANSSDLVLTSYSAILDTGGKIREQLFAPDVPANDAIALLNSRLQRTNVSAEISATPMNNQRTQIELSQYPLNTNIMNDQNLSYLQKQLLNQGFGEHMNAELEKQITAKTPEFTLSTTQEYNKQNVDYNLHYKAGDKDEMYFFNKYDASMQDKAMAQTFYINKGSGITAKEAYNLMDGRAVHKQLENQEGEKYNAWLVLDKENKTDNGNHKLNHFTDKWNYKPERAIDKLDIVGINEEGAREKLMKSLEKGNRHQVTAMKDGKEVKLWLEANPAEHRVNLTNYKGEAQKLEHYKKPELKTEQKKDQKQAQTQEDAPEKKQSRKRGAKMSV
jgi:hypothetical protein